MEGKGRRKGRMKLPATLYTLLLLEAWQPLLAQGGRYRINCLTVWVTSQPLRQITTIHTVFRLGEAI